jgi:exopolyphosphatase / guanosine-5'-triphosphate,3'-diphosphate pyrophosphatase
VRLGVLDVGSNTVHLLVVDAQRGGHPTPTSSTKTSLRLAEHVHDGRLRREGADALVAAVASARAEATTLGC